MTRAPCSAAWRGVLLVRLDHRLLVAGPRGLHQCRSDRRHRRSSTRADRALTLRDHLVRSTGPGRAPTVRSARGWRRSARTIRAPGCGIPAAHRLRDVPSRGVRRVDRDDRGRLRIRWRARGDRRAGRATPSGRVDAELVGGWCDRWGARRVLTAGMYVQSVAMASIGILLALDAPHVLAYAGAVVATWAVIDDPPRDLVAVPSRRARATRDRRRRTSRSGGSTVPRR